MSAGISFCLRFFGLILSAITTVFTIILWSELPQDSWTSFLMGLAGFSLEGCKFLLLILAVYFYREQFYFASLMGGALSVLLFIVSIGASIGFLEKSEQQNRQQSWQVQQIRDQYRQLNDEIELLTDSARRDVVSGYRKRALETQKRIDQLRLQQNQIQDEPLTGIAGSSFSGLGVFFGMADDRIRFVAWVLLALLIDGVAAACWVFLTLLKTPEMMVGEKETFPATDLEPQEIKELSETPETLPEVPEPPVSTPKTVEHAEYNRAFYSMPDTMVTVDDPQEDLFTAVQEKIDSNQAGYDENMSLNSLMRLESIGYAKARKVMDKIELQKKQA